MLVEKAPSASSGRSTPLKASADTEELEAQAALGWRDEAKDPEKDANQAATPTDMRRYVSAPDLPTLADVPSKAEGTEGKLGKTTPEKEESKKDEDEKEEGEVDEEAAVGSSGDAPPDQEDMQEEQGGGGPYSAETMFDAALLAAAAVAKRQRI